MCRGRLPDKIRSGRHGTTHFLFASGPSIGSDQMEHYRADIEHYWDRTREALGLPLCTANLESNADGCKDLSLGCHCIRLGQSSVPGPPFFGTMQAHCSRMDSAHTGKMLLIAYYIPGWLYWVRVGCLYRSRLCWHTNPYLASPTNKYANQDGSVLPHGRWLSHSRLCDREGCYSERCLCRGLHMGYHKTGDMHDRRASVEFDLDLATDPEATFQQASQRLPWNF